MKTNSTLGFFMFIVTIGFAQTALTDFSMPYGHRKLIIGPYLTTAMMPGFSQKAAFGVDAEFMVAKNFGFGATVGGGHNYAEVSTAVLGLVGLGALNSDFNNGFWLVLLSPLVFENPTFHFEPNNNQEFVLSASLAKIRYVYDYEEQAQNTFMSGSIKLRYSQFYRSQWQWSFFIEAVSLYTHGSPKGMQMGFSVRHVSRRQVR